MSDPVVLLSTGDVVGPAGGVTDNSMVLFSGTSGKLIKGNNAQVTSAGLALLDDIDANAQLTTLGLTTTQPQFDNSVKQATTEFVQRALGNHAGATIAQVTGSRTMLASEAGSVTWLGDSGGGSHTITLPPIASVLRGASFTFIATGSNSTYTVVGSGAELTITYSGAGQSAGFTANQVILIGGGSIELVSNGTYWFVKSGQMQHLDVFKASLSANGYQKLPSGLIIQWGKVSLTGGINFTTVSFPIAFTVKAASITCTPADNLGGKTAESAELGVFTLSTFQVAVLDPYATGSNTNLCWIAIGY